MARSSRRRQDAKLRLCSHLRRRQTQLQSHSPSIPSRAEQQYGPQPHRRPPGLEWARSQATEKGTREPSWLEEFEEVAVRWAGDETVNVNATPRCPTFSAQIRPPCASTMPLAMDSPRPTPPGATLSR